jgi:site-specific DNA-methyltransferase (adenine-specific)
MQKELKIEYIGLDDLVPYINNAKEHPDSQIDQIVASIKEFGFNDPIAIDGESVIIEGHGRLLAAKKLQLKQVPIIRLDHLTEAQKKAYILAHNKLTMNSGFDEELLKVELEALANDFDYNLNDLEITGFNLDELVDLDLDIEDDTELSREYDKDEADAVPDADGIKVVIKQGDLIELDNHRLLCGDSTNIESVKILVGGGMVDLLLTDPPYNVAYEGKTKDVLTIQNDSMDNDSFRNFLVDVYKAADSVMKPGAVFYIWHADSEGLNFRGAASDVGWKIRQCLIWNKNSMVLGRQDYHWKHEPCLYGWKEGAAHLWNTDRKQTTILEFDKPVRSDIHPTMKPVNLIEYQVLNSSKEDQVVLDLFGGSGSTLIACENSNRSCCTMELDEKYAQVIIQRWCDYTGVDAIKINGQDVNWSEYKEHESCIN